MNAEILELKKRIERLEAALLSRSPVTDRIPTEEEAKMALRDNDFGPALLMIRARKGEGHGINGVLGTGHAGDNRGPGIPGVGIDQ